MKFKMNTKIVLPVCVVLVVAVIVASVLISKEDAAVMNEPASDISTEETIEAVSADNPLEGDKYPEINELVGRYLAALAEGDVDTIGSITNNMTDIERIRVEELGKCIDAFPAYNVFTKIGPTEGSYIAYVAVRTQFPGVETLVPGIYCFYVCTDENGSYYFNEATLTQEEQTYIDAISADASVVSLMESFETEYQELMDTDEAVRSYVELMQNEIRGTVGESLASVSAETQESTSSEETEQTDPTILHSECKAVTTTTLNVRSSDSEKSEKLGKLPQGTTVDVIEIRINGWTKISYEGKEAYLKTDYLEILE